MSSLFGEESLPYEPLVRSLPGATVIAEERKRQIEDELYGVDHDAEHMRAELIRASVCYAQLAAHQTFASVVDGIPVAWRRPPRTWPWGVGDWKPSPQPERNLAKAGALMAAEIDRIDWLRVNGQVTDE